MNRNGFPFPCKNLFTSFRVFEPFSKHKLEALSFFNDIDHDKQGWFMLPSCYLGTSTHVYTVLHSLIKG